METAAHLIAQMRRRVKVDTSQYTDANALIDLNTLKDSFWSEVVTNIPESYNWDSWKVDNTTLISEYQIPEVAYDTAWAKKLKAISMNYNWDTYTNSGLPIYIPAREVNPATLEHQWNYYAENQSTSDPIYYVADNSYFIAPAFRESNLSERIKLTWIRKIPDYTLATTEAEMKIPVDQQQALVFWLMIDWYFNKWVDDNTINNAEARWIRKRDEAISQLSNRVENPTTFELPNELVDNNCLNLTRA